MQNIFFGVEGKPIVYDLKGSEVNRLAMPSSPQKSFTGLDTNFLIDKDGCPYTLQEGLFNRTLSAIEDDARFLKDHGVIDYSLLVI